MARRGYLQSQDTTKAKLTWNYEQFGTLDTTSDPSAIDEADSPDTLNTVYDLTGSVGTRQGYTKLLTNAVSGSIYGMVPLYKSDGTRQLVYASSQNLQMYNNAGGSTQLTGTPANFTPNQQWSFDVYQDNVYGGNGVDAIAVYNGSAYSVLNAGTFAQYVKIHRNRVYVAPRNSSTLIFSDAGNPSSFPVNNFIQINTNDGQVITGIEEDGDNLVIFKTDSIWILSGEPLGAGNTTTIGNLQLQKVNTPGVGCTAFRSIVPVAGAIFFYHYSGIYAYQNGQVREVLPKLATTFSRDFNPNYLDTTWAVYNPNNNYYLLGFTPVGIAGGGGRVIAYNTLTRRTSIWDDMPGSCAVNFKFTGNVPTTLMGGSTKGFIYNMFTGYADIAGDNGTVTAISFAGSTITDSSKSWISGQFADARVKIYDAVGNVIASSTITSNGSNAVYVSPTFGITIAPGMTYSIGYYDSYWKTKVSPFEREGYSKKYRYQNMYVDATQYPLLYGVALDYQTLRYQKTVNTSTNTPIWGSFTWGTGNWGGAAGTQFVQANIGGTGRYYQAIFGNNLANRPWRISNHSISFRLKKMRANIVSV